jgi:hypothetical protein
MPKITATDRVETHHSSDVKDWREFEKNLKSRAFKKAVELHPASDDKLKRYVAANYNYRSSKKTVGTVPSTSTEKKYEIRVMPRGGLGCSCKDWQYKKSHGGKHCKHISAYLAANRQSPPVKVASIIAGVTLARSFGKADKALEKGKKMEANRRRLRKGENLEPV